MCQGNEDTPALTIKDYTLEAISQFTYLGSTTSNDACLDMELGKRIGTCKAATNRAKLSDRVWENKKLTTQTKVAVYRACIMSTLLYGSQFWTTYTGQEKHLNIFHMRFLRRILSIEWMDKVSNNKVLERAEIPSAFTLLRQHRLRWLARPRALDGRRANPQGLAVHELEFCFRPVGRPKLRFKDVYKRYACYWPANGQLETHAADQGDWRSLCSLALQVGETRLKAEADERRAKRKAAVNTAECVPAAYVFVCNGSGCACRSRIGLFSHEQKCVSQSC